MSFLFSDFYAVMDGSFIVGGEVGYLNQVFRSKLLDGRIVMNDPRPFTVLHIDMPELHFVSRFQQLLQISPERCDDFALGGVSLSVPAVWSFRMNGAFRLWV